MKSGALPESVSEEEETMKTVIAFLLFGGPGLPAGDSVRNRATGNREA
jgi:hypothetical protein